MRRIAIILMALACLWATTVMEPALAQEAQPDLPPLSAQDLATLDRISAPQLSPDGRYLAYVRRTTADLAHASISSLEVVDLNRDREQPLAVFGEEGGGFNPQWSADGRWLYFLSSRSGSQQVWRVNPQGEALQQLTDFPLSVGDFRPTRDQRAVLVTINAYPDCDSLGCIVARDAARAPGSGRLIVSGPARYAEAIEDDKLSGVFRADLSDALPATEARRIVRQFNADLSLSEGRWAESRDGRTYYFISFASDVEKGSETSYNLYASPANGRSAPRLLAGRLGHWISSLALSPDGRELAYRATRGSMWTFGRTTIMIRNLLSGRTRELTPDADILFQQVIWSADGRALLANAEEQGRGPLYRIDAATGALTQLRNEGSVADFDEAAGTLVYLHSNYSSPPQIWSYREGEPAQRVTDASDELLNARGLSAWEQFSFSGWNDEIVHGYIMQPHGYVEGRRYPVAMLIHGGPQQSFADAWSFRWNPQVFAGMGYAVVLIDFHGSTGYGEAFGLSSVGHWGDRPLEDLQRGWSFALENYPYLDADRACAVGGSYGGYLVNWMASQWDEPWRCFVSHAGVFDTRFMRLSTSIDAFVDAQFGGAPTLDDLERFNPALQTDSWSTPILVTHGSADVIVPIDQGISAYNAARENRVPAEMLLYPDEGHLILRPANSVQWYSAIEHWLARWTAPD